MAPRGYGRAPGMASYAVIGRAIRVLSSNSGVQGEAWFGNGDSGGKGSLERRR
jgi:hypothetical protein